MMHKLKKMVVAAAIALTCVVPQLSAQQSRSAGYVDRDGFIYSSQDTGYYLGWIKDVYKVLIKNLTADPDVKVLDTVVTELWNEVNADSIGRTETSGKEIAPDFFAVKQFTAIPVQKRTGFIWKLFIENESTQPVPFIDAMPKNTLIGFGGKFDGAVLMSTIDKYVAKYAGPAEQQQYAAIFAEGIRNGVDIRKIVNSVDGVAFYVEADPARQIMPGFSSAALILSVKDRSIMELLINEAKVKNPAIVTANNELIIPTEIGAVAVFQVNNYIVVTTDPAGVKNVIAGKAPSLKQNPDYIKYSAGTPANGSSFLFVSSELGKSVIPAYATQLPPSVTTEFDVLALCKTAGIGPALYCVNYSNQYGVGSVCNTGSKGLALISSDPALSSAIMTVISEIISETESEPDFSGIDY